jgi:hypothetical protein
MKFPYAEPLNRSNYSKFSHQLQWSLSIKRLVICTLLNSILFANTMLFSARVSDYLHCSFATNHLMEIDFYNQRGVATLFLGVVMVN